MKLFPILRIVAVLFVPAISFSQTNYQPGIVVKNNGDTLRGFINEKEWSRNPDRFEFKGSMEGESIVFNAQAIRSVSVDDETFISYVGPVSMDPVDLKDVRATELGGQKSNVDTVFLKLVAAGPAVQLFQYRDKIKTRYFMAYPGQKPEELVYRKYAYVSRDKGPSVAEVTTYRRQLTEAAERARALTEDLKIRISKVAYTASAIESIVDRINPAGSKMPGQRKKSNKGGNVWFVGLGTNSTKVAFSTIDPSVRSSSPAGFYFNLGFDHPVNRNVGKIVFRGDLSVSSGKLNFTSNFFNGPYKSSQTTMALSLLGRYNFYNTKALRIYLAPGLQLKHSFYSNNLYPVPNTGGGVYTNMNDQAVYMALMAQAGIVIHQRFELVASYSTQLGTVPSDWQEWTEKFNVVRIGVNYHFGKLIK